MSEITLPKFGGTSMARPEMVAAIVESRPDYPAVVVSAAGKDDNTPFRMTDSLLTYANNINDGLFPAAREISNSVIERYDDLYADLDSDVRRALRQRMADAFRSRPQDPDLLVPYSMSLGEYGSAHYFAARIDGQVVDDWVLFGNRGNLWPERTVNRLVHLYNSGAIDPHRTTVFPGYYGLGASGQRFTLDRGGSDRTQALAARALSRLYGGDHNILSENWTDVNGINSIDPRIVKVAAGDGVKKHKEQISRAMVSRSEVREGAHGGAEVLQGDAIVDLNGSSIVTVVRNSFNTSQPGTLVVPREMLDERYTGSDEQPIVGVSGRQLLEVSASDLGMSNQVGYLWRLLGKAVAQGLSIEHLPATQDAVGLTLRSNADPDKVSAFIDGVRGSLLSKNGTVGVEEKGVVYVVGEHLKNPLVRSRIIGELGTIATTVGCGIEDVVSNRFGPSIALLVESDAVVPMQLAIHNELV